ncbi:STAS/SEC14 domain-containing protein [Agromyces sp. C10]|uniref:STAS/SEC14 domain-containing protein n=1 Tax=Agromyces sp. C10 TaxID=2935077 RepID=UPI00200B80A3|nr:STAS/SEC14 domain-containing protein [Agromyces sp. C10]MCK8607898.1 STAS/SEC14 domain-containing protein [Agromyces sp. C10]
MTPAVEAAVEEHGEVKLMLDLTDFRWEKVGAWGADLRFGHEFHEKVARMAIVGHKKWEERLAHLAFYAREAAYFEDPDAAWAWLRSEAGRDAFVDDLFEQLDLRALELVCGRVEPVVARAQGSELDQQHGRVERRLALHRDAEAQAFAHPLLGPGAGLDARASTRDVLDRRRLRDALVPASGAVARPGVRGRGGRSAGGREDRALSQRSAGRMSRQRGIRPALFISGLRTVSLGTTTPSRDLPHRRHCPQSR